MPTPSADGTPAGTGPRIRPYLQRPPSIGQPAEAPAPGGEGPRPFVLTGGRVTGAYPDITIETQVSACSPDSSRPRIPLSTFAPELRAIVAMCAIPCSVAEISAHLKLHLGVTKILVGDLRAAGHVDVYPVDVSTADDPDIILRVINGLRAIS